LELTPELLGPKLPFGISVTNVVHDVDDEGDEYFLVSFRVSCVIDAESLVAVPYGTVDTAEIGKADSDATYWWRSIPVKTIVYPESDREASGFAAAAEFYAGDGKELEFAERQKAWRIWATIAPGEAFRFTLGTDGYVDAVDVAHLRWCGKGFGEAETLISTPLVRSLNEKFSFKLPAASQAALPEADAPAQKAPTVPSKKRSLK
jgi:hypothetical protein